MNVALWIVMGLVAGLIARALVPGRDSLGVVGTIVLGLVGSLVGGFLGSLLSDGDADFSTAGLLGSIVGAILALIAWRSMSGRGHAI